MFQTCLRDGQFFSFRFTLLFFIFKIQRQGISYAPLNLYWYLSSYEWKLSCLGYMNNAPAMFWFTQDEHYAKA